MGLIDKLEAGKPLKVKEAEALLKKLGFSLSHIRGSHHHWVRDQEIFTLPIHGKELKRWITRELRKLYYGQKK